MYQTIKESDISNTIVKELNAAVCTATFPGEGLHKSDLYTSVNSSDVLVFTGSCAPANTTYVCTVEIYIN